MKQYSGKSIEDIVDVVAIERGIDQSLVYYHIVEEREDFVTLDVYTDDDVMEFIKNYIEQFFHNLEMDVYVSIEFSEQVYRVNINAENNAIVIGRQGETLRSLTTVVRNATNSYFKRRYQIVIDVNNYKANRYEKVQSMVYPIARSVQDTRVAATLDFMPSDERRVVHKYLDGMENIKTESIGEGADRRLVIKYVEED